MARGEACGVAVEGLWSALKCHVTEARGTGWRGLRRGCTESGAVQTADMDLPSTENGK